MTKRTVVSNSICTARTAPSLPSSMPPPLVKNAKFHRDASCSLSTDPFRDYQKGSPSRDACLGWHAQTCRLPSHPQSVLRPLWIPNSSPSDGIGYTDPHQYWLQPRLITGPDVLHNITIPLPICLFFPERRHTPILSSSKLEAWCVCRFREGDRNLDGLVQGRSDSVAFLSRWRPAVLDLLHDTYQRSSMRRRVTANVRIDQTCSSDHQA